MDVILLVGIIIPLSMVVAILGLSCSKRRYESSEDMDDREWALSHFAKEDDDARFSDDVGVLESHLDECDSNDRIDLNDGAVLLGPYVYTTEDNHPKDDDIVLQTERSLEESRNVSCSEEYLKSLRYLDDREFKTAFMLAWSCFEKEAKKLLNVDASGNELVKAVYSFVMGTETYSEKELSRTYRLLHRARIIRNNLTHGNDAKAIELLHNSVQVAKKLILNLVRVTDMLSRSIPAT